VTGIDVADAQIEAARTRAANAGVPNVSFVTANLDAGVPFPNECFDVVTGIAVLAMVFDPIAVLNELHRVLKPRGHLLLEVPNLAYLPRRLALLRGHLPRVSAGHGWDGGHLHNFTLDSLRNLLRTHGFVVERVTGSGIFAPLRSWRPSLLTGNLILVSRRA
jgi:SAM-dependent methyltransferase